MRKVKFDKVMTILGFIAFALIILFIVEKLMNVKSDNMEAFKVQSEAWIVKNETEYFKADYKDVSLPNIKEGDVITVTMEIPMDRVDSPVLVFQSGHDRIKVYQGGYHIYSYGELQSKRNTLIADSGLIIPLDLEKGNELRIEIMIEQSTFLYEFPDILLMDAAEVGNYKLTGNAVHTFIGLFLMLFGAILLMFFIANLRKAYLTSNLELLTMAFYSILGGIWMWTHYGILEMFWDNADAIYFLNIISEFVTPILILFFLYIKLRHEKTKFMFKGLAVSAVIFIVLVLLSLTMKCFFPFFSHIILWFYFILIISVFEWYLLGAYFKKRNKLNGFILASVISYYISIIMCYFSLQKDDFSFVFFHKVYCNTIVFMIVQMFLSYAVPMMNDLQGRTEREVLIELAYVDGLTGLLNRNRSEEIMNQIRYDEENFYYVVEFEIVNLKKINRSCGYVAGDQKLIEFANSLREAFEDAMLVSRYSGDEFIVILENEQQEKLDRCMEMFMEKIRNYNEQQDEKGVIQYVYGIGECNCMIKGHDIYKMLKVADKRKYEKAKQGTFDK